MSQNTTTTTATTTTPVAHLVTSNTTSSRKRISWLLVFASTTSTSRMESATCSTYLNLVYRHLPSSMVQHLHSQNGLVNFEPTSTSANSSTSTSCTSLTTLNNLSQQTSRSSHLQRTNIGWEMCRHLRHQYAAGARVQQCTLLQSIVHPQRRWTKTSQPMQQHLLLQVRPHHM